MPEIEFVLWTDLLVNAVAVLLGGIGALALARWRMKRESAAEKQSLAVFERQEDGNWRIAALVVNRDPETP